MSKNDCCSNKVTLDLDEMIKVCAAAIFNSRIQLERHEHSIQDNLFRANRLKDDDYEKYSLLCSTHSEQVWLKESAIQYAEAVDMYFYLMQAKAREEIVVIKGEVK